jgi:hypothetical protein
MPDVQAVNDDAHNCKVLGTTGVGLQLQTDQFSAAQKLCDELCVAFFVPLPLLVEYCRLVQHVVFSTAVVTVWQGCSFEVDCRPSRLELGRVFCLCFMSRRCFHCAEFCAGWHGPSFYKILGQSELKVPGVYAEGFFVVVTFHNTPFLVY